ncbi:uncharacterized protein EI97DRAFT_232590 [Westerdykella ornata]|uniref:peptidylprolyl isomerase n=1 Tax=Westerdykella ornata TaxID=318751 RepID=A0A6A6J7M8_WESOR|nr:uncharacterized protein EI97DRAFT_232590 [Westerdykella ornata]KAF2272234.1 hypothetical protein EI97DRAFT_232590 [Westerdykella ornata]
MAAMLPASVYGLRVPAGGFPVPGAQKFPASFRITMAAIDPTAEPQMDEENKALRSTLKIIRLPMSEDDEDDEDDEDYDEDSIQAIKERLKGIISDEEDSEEDSEDEKNGGPSDPAKSKKAKQAALTKKLQEELDEEMELDSSFTNGINGASSKGKGRANDDDEIDSEEEDDEDDEPEEFVICTLDPEKNAQQTLDITVGEHEHVYFSSTGTYDIYLTGNYVLPPDEFGEGSEEDEEDDDMDYDLSPDEDELDDISDSEEDELDGMGNPRITEIDTDEEEAPKLVEAGKKGKNKRPAESEDEANLDDMITKSKEAATNGDKLSKKQAKKLKKNDGEAAPAEPAKKETPSSDKKKVQFAKNLEQGPTGSPKVEEAKKAEPKKEAPKTGPRNVGGVLVEDKKLGKGRAAKKGDRIEMRYIGKLKNGKQFDANKKGKPFSFKLGVGDVIKGWDIGVAGICPGGERRLTIPAKLAYGSKALPDIPANSDLIFDIKCISVS